MKRIFSRIMEEGLEKKDGELEKKDGENETRVLETRQASQIAAKENIQAIENIKTSLSLSNNKLM
ncbi:MAG: hypothetical protein WAW59_03930 [Patescibacteria group bacterium]